MSTIATAAERAAAAGGEPMPVADRADRPGR
jgi:hypothetical protein